MTNDSNAPFRTLIFVLAYNARKHIASVFDRIPESIWQDANCDVLVIDDSSQDDTCDVCREYAEHTGRHITVLRTPSNQGYGGNQKLGYRYAIEHGYDAVVMLHGDGQYAPEMLPDMIAPLAERRSEVVFGSRMMNRKGALEGGMPKYKFVANIALTTLQNWMIGTRLSEFHTGYRAYATSALKRIPFRYNSDWFDFDTDIIIQIADNKIAVHEIAIPTHYGDEICHVDNVRYGKAILRACLISRLQRYGIFYSRQFDYEPTTEYRSKTHFPSSQSFAIDQISSGQSVMVVGCGADHVIEALRHKGCTIVEHTGDPLDSESYQNLRADVLILLDMVGNTASPEYFLEQLYERIKGSHTRLVITSPNIGFFIPRFMLLIGRFEYGKRGILDKSHRRIFTFPSLRRLLEQSGYVVHKIHGIPAPFPLALQTQWLARLLLRIDHGLIHLSKGMFAFQIGMIATPKQDFDTVFTQTLHSGTIASNSGLAETG